MEALYADGGDSQVDLTSIPVGVYIATAIVILALILVLVIAAYVAYRRSKRTGSWRRAKLTVQSEALPPGPQRQLARLRLRLDNALSAASSAVLVSSDVAVAGNLASVNEQLQQVGHRISHQLDVLAETGANIALQRLLIPLQNRVDDVERLAGQIADAAGAALGGAADVDLTDLTGAVAEELQTVNLRVDALRELSNSTTPPDLPRS